MTPRLALSQLELIRNVIVSDEPLTAPQIAEAAGCIERSIKKCFPSNLKLFGCVRASPNGVGRRRSITPLMLEALYDHLLENPSLYLDETVVFLWEEFPQAYDALHCQQSSRLHWLVQKDNPEKSKRTKCRFARFCLPMRKTEVFVVTVQLCLLLQTTIAPEEIEILENRTEK